MLHPGAHHVLLSLCILLAPEGRENVQLLTLALTSLCSSPVRESSKDCSVNSWREARDGVSLGTPSMSSPRLPLLDLLGC